MSSITRASEELKALAWYCSEENATGTISEPHAFLGVGKTVFASFADQQVDPRLVMYSIYGTGWMHDSGDYAELNLHLLTPYQDIQHISPRFVRQVARVGLHVSNEDVLVSVDRNEGGFAKTPLELFIAPLGKWALETFPSAEKPSAEFVNLFRTSGAPDQSTVEALKAKMRHPLDDSVDVTELTDFFTSKESKASLFEWTYVGLGELFMKVKKIE